MYRTLLWLSLLPVVGSAAPEENWTRFRGPNGSGHSSADTIPVTWTANDYNWKVTLPGTGHSSPVVWGKKVFLTCADEESALRMVLCLSTENGRTLWRRNYESQPFRQHRDNSFASASPAVDDTGVYVTWTTPDEVTFLGLGHDGTEKWHRRLGAFESRFGSGASPIVVGDLVILPNDQRGESFIIAVDRESGKTRWKSARQSSNTPNVTPCIYTPPGGPAELILINTTHGVTSLDPKTGRVNWELDGLARNLDRERPVTSPIIASGSVIGGYGMAGQGTQLFAVRPGSETGNAKPQLLHRFARPLPYVPTPLASGDRLFVWHDSGTVLCYRTGTGELRWRGKVEGSFYGSPVLVNEHLYCISKKGVVVVLPAADTFRPPSYIPLGELSYATPAVAGGSMYLRTYSHLFSIGGKKRTAAAKRPDTPSVNDAFAVIGVASVKGNFHQYPPFYSNVIAPHAVTAQGRVYCAFQNTKGQPVVMAYDQAEKQWFGPVRAAAFGLGKDAHGNPSICLDTQGYIHVFYGCHGRAMRHTRSVRPYDITAWEEQSPPTKRATYPQSMRMADGSISLFYRAGGHMEPWNHRVSRDNGGTWGEAEKIVEMRLAPRDPLAAAYASLIPGSDGRTIHLFWIHKDDNAARVKGERKHPWRPLKYKGLHEAVYRYNMYYLKRHADGIWRTAAGKKAALPVSKAFADEHCMVFDSGDEFTNIGRPMVDAEDRPYVRFRYGVGDWKKGGNTAIPWRSRYAHWRDGSWLVTDRIPEDWPNDVRAWAGAMGPAAFGDTSHGRWFIFSIRKKLRDNAGASIFLYHEKDGYAIRSGGPAPLP